MTETDPVDDSQPENPIPPPSDIPVPPHLVQHLSQVTLDERDPESVEEAAALERLTGNDGAMGTKAIQDRIADKLTSGFKAIEQMGFSGDEAFMREWEEHQQRVLQFFRDHNPSEPGFQEARKALVSNFGHPGGAPSSDAPLAAEAEAEEQGESDADADEDLEESGAAGEGPPAAGPAPGQCFYSVYHTFTEGATDAWWERVGAMTPDDMAAQATKQREQGFYNHSFMPAGILGPINCLWECRQDTSPEDFQAFIDGPGGPGPGVFVNTCYKAMLAASVVPRSAFGPAVPPAAPNMSGTFFWVVHRFASGRAPEWWAWAAALSPAARSKLLRQRAELGFYNHSFMPVDMEGGPALCVWEAKDDISVEEFQAFVDGPDGAAAPGHGGPEGALVNEVHKAMPGSTKPTCFFKDGLFDFMDW